MIAPPPFLRRAVADTPTLTVTVDGVPVTVQSGDTVATAVLLTGSQPYRHTLIGGVPRSPFCMMGVCFECLVTIDGAANRQSCLVAVKEGMEVTTGHARRSIGP